MLGHKYTTELEVRSEQERLNDLLGVKLATAPYITILEGIDGCWYILHNEAIAPYMPDPIEITFNTEDNANTTNILP